MATDIEDSKIIPQFVRVIIQNEQGEILVMKTKYPKQLIWNFPGGKVEKDEQPRAAAVRETFEETNLLIGNLEELGGFEIDKNLWGCHVYFTKNYANELYNKEPHKCSNIEFMSLTEITKLENLSNVTEKILEIFSKKANAFTYS